MIDKSYQYEYMTSYLSLSQPVIQILEQALIQIWQENLLQNTHELKQFLTARRRALQSDHSRLAKEMFQRAQKKMRPKLRALEQCYEKKLEKLEREYYAQNKRLSVGCLDDRLEEKRKLCQYFQKSVS